MKFGIQATMGPLYTLLFGTYAGSVFSTPVHMHDGLICITLRLSVCGWTKIQGPSYFSYSAFIFEKDILSRPTSGALVVQET